MSGLGTRMTFQSLRLRSKSRLPARKILSTKAVPVSDAANWGVPEEDISGLFGRHESIVVVEFEPVVGSELTADTWYLKILHAVLCSRRRLVQSPHIRYCTRVIGYKRWLGYCNSTKSAFISCQHGTYLELTAYQEARAILKKAGVMKEWFGGRVFHSTNVNMEHERQILYQKALSECYSTCHAALRENSRPKTQRVGDRYCCIILPLQWTNCSWLCG